MDPRTAEHAKEMVTSSIALMTQELGIAPADAGRALLAELARWFGIDFRREARAVEAVLEE